MTLTVSPSKPNHITMAINSQNPVWARTSAVGSLALNYWVHAGAIGGKGSINPFISVQTPSVY